MVCQESCRYLSNAATPQTESQQDKVNYAVSEREDRVINRCDDNKRMTSCTGMYRAATGLY